MAEALRKLNPAWVAVVMTFVINVGAISYGYGRLSERQDNMDHRVILLENNDKEQSRQLGEAASRLARIEEGVTYIRDSIRGVK